MAVDDRFESITVSKYEWKMNELSVRSSGEEEENGTVRIQFTINCQGEPQKDYLIV